MDLIVANENERIEPKVRKAIPPEYLAIKLSSLGKLSAPYILHFRDYSVDDAMRMGLSAQDNILETLIGALNKMVYEEFDCNQLHEIEVEEIMLNIYANFWGQTIEYPFPFTDEEYENISGEQKSKYEKESPTVVINLPKLISKVIPDEFKEPIIFTDEVRGIKIQFILPRIGHMFMARDFINDKYKKEEQIFHALEEKLKFNSNSKDEIKHKIIDIQELNAYNTYVKNRMEDYVACKQSLSIIKYGDEDLSSMPFEQRATYYSKIPYKLWQFISNTFDNMTFGISHDVEVKNPIDGKPTTRRFLFQLLDFIPSSELQEYNGFTVSFGE